MVKTPPFRGNSQEISQRWVKLQYGPFQSPGKNPGPDVWLQSHLSLTHLQACSPLPTPVVCPCNVSPWVQTSGCSNPSAAPATPSTGAVVGLCETSEWMESMCVPGTWQVFKRCLSILSLLYPHHHWWAGDLKREEGEYLWLCRGLPPSFPAPPPHTVEMICYK